LGYYHDTRAICLFASYGTENEWPDSDVDIALLLPPEQAKTKRMLAMSPLCSELGSLLGKAVDLVNLRVVSTGNWAAPGQQGQLLVVAACRVD
jgi:uncharacterized protein